MNRELLYDAMLMHEQYQSRVTNTAWINGDRACLAGRIVLLAGATVSRTGLRPEIGRTVDYQGRKRDVPELAAEIAGLTAMEARWLFHWRRTLPEIRSAVNDIRDDRAITGRPYWIDTEADHRFITPGGVILAAAHRRTVFLRMAGKWTDCACPSPGQAARLARVEARAAGAAPYRLTERTARRSITA